MAISWPFASQQAVTSTVYDCATSGRKPVSPPIKPEYKGFDLIGRQDFTNRIWSRWTSRPRLPFGRDPEYSSVDAFDPYPEWGKTCNFEMRGADCGDDLRECVHALAFLIKFLGKARETRCNQPLEHSRRLQSLQ